MSVQGEHGDLMDSARGAASHKPSLAQATGRATVYVQTSTQSVASMGVITCKQLTLKAAPGSVKSQWTLPAAVNVPDSIRPSHYVKSATHS